MRRFLALVPRGLEEVITKVVQDAVTDAQISFLATKREDGLSPEQVGLRAREDLIRKRHARAQRIAASVAVTATTTTTTGVIATHPQRWDVVKRTATATITQNHQSCWFRHAVGTGQLSGTSSTELVNVGYTQQNNCSWSVPGTLEGSVWMQIDTVQVEAMASLRCLGPLLAIVTSTEDMNVLSDPGHSLSSMLEDFGIWLTSHRDKYAQGFASSLELWKEYVQLSWKDTLSDRDYEDLQKRIAGEELRFRMSCMRNHATTTSSYARQDFLTELMDRFGPTLVPSYSSSKGESKEQHSSSTTTITTTTTGWTVSLKQYDVELVVILLSNGCMAMGISLNPYSFFHAKGFYSGIVPPDISKPYIGHDSLDGLVRLRPTTAHLLLHLADLQPYEMVLDPCAGIGTIPLEADAFFHATADNNNNNNNSNKRCVVGIGGDICLNHPSLTTAASSMETLGRSSSSSSSTPTNTGPPSSSSLLAAWDAANLPIRSVSVDVILSDLPFGKQCLSSNALKQLLPLVFLECARVLVPSKGRMVLLCGNPSLITDALVSNINNNSSNSSENNINKSEASNDKKPSSSSSSLYWQTPCTIATPVTIGGLQAWIIRVERNSTAFATTNHPKRLEQIRSLARKRDQVQLQQRSEDKKKKQSMKRRRVQS